MRCLGLRDVEMMTHQTALPDSSADLAITSWVSVGVVGINSIHPICRGMHVVRREISNEQFRRSVWAIRTLQHVSALFEELGLGTKRAHLFDLLCKKLVQCSAALTDRFNTQKSRISPVQLINCPVLAICML